MKKEKAIIASTFLIFLILGLNTRFGIIPPIGKILSPFTGYLQNAKEANISGEINCGKLTAPVKILFDKRIVPHVFAASDADLYFAQGYLHAKNRLFQMDFTSRVASGNLSEVVGEETLDMDRASRRKGLLWSAENTLAFIQKNHPATYKHLEAYANGVNLYLEELSDEELPVEFKILAYSPGKWSPLKTILIQKYMADMLAGYDDDAARTNSLLFLGQKNYNAIYKNRLARLSPMIDSMLTTAPLVSKDTQELADFNTAYLNSGKPSHSDKFQPKPGYGSNSWVLSGKKTKTGFPILANDPHLPLTLPSIWYEMQLSSGTSNTYGVSIPGVPYIIIGYNENIAWGITSGQTDVKDWYALQFRNNNTEYYFGDKWHPATERIERYAIFGSPDFIDTVKQTSIGPVVYDEHFKGDPGRINMALKWEVHTPSNDFNTFYLLNNSVNYDGYANAIKTFGCPNLNFSFSSRSDIAIAHQGRIPIRKQGEGEFVIDGSRISSMSSAYIPNKDLPHSKNPEKGFLFSANQKPAGDNYPYYLYGYYAEYRNRTINNVLSASSQMDVQDMMDLQMNDFDLFAAEALPVMLKAMDTKKLTKEDMWFVDSLKAWNYKSDKHILAPLCFYAWWDEFQRQTWDEILDLKIPGFMPSYDNTVRMIQENPGSKYFDRQSTPEKETAGILLASTLKECAAQFIRYEKKTGKLSWGKNKETAFMHIAQISAFSTEGVVCNGSENSVNATTSDWGPGWRMIVEFGKGMPNAWGINPGGQSGNPGSSYYSNGIEQWADGKYNKLLFLKNADDKAEIIQTLTIN